MATLSAVLAQIRQNESGGNYGLTPEQNFAYPSSHASGAYQFQPGTWQQLTAQSGIGTQYSEAYQAPANIQDAVAAYAATHGNVNSTSLWGGGTATYPAITSDDVTPQGLASGSQTLAGSTDYTGNQSSSVDPLTGAPIGSSGLPATSSTTPAASTTATGLPAIGTWFANWAVRGGLILGGLVLLLGAAWALSSSSTTARHLRTAATAAAEGGE